MRDEVDEAVWVSLCLIECLIGTGNLLPVEGLEKLLKLGRR